MPANPKTTKRPARTYLYRTVARLLTALAAPLAFSTASATDTQTVYTPSGKPLFAVTFLEKGQYFSQADPQEDSPSLWNMNAQQKNATLSALSLWAETLGPGSANTTPLQIEVTTNNDFNASGGDLISGGMTGAEALLTQNRPQSLPAYFIIGQMDFSYASHFSPIPETGGTDIISASSITKWHTPWASCPESGKAPTAHGYQPSRNGTPTSTIGTAPVCNKA